MKKLIAILALCIFTATSLYSQGQVVKARKVQADTIFSNSKVHIDSTANEIAVDGSGNMTFKDQITGTSYTLTQLTEKGTATSDMWNVKDAPFNAAGDGVTDDRAAIQKALDSAFLSTSYKIVYVPEGTYLVGETNVPYEHNLTIRSNVTLMGAGMYSTFLKKDSGGTNDSYFIRNYYSGYDANGDSNIVIKDLTVDGNNIQQTHLDPANSLQTGIRLGQCTNLFLDRVRVIRNWGTRGGPPGEGMAFHFVSCSNVNVTNCIAQGDTLSSTGFSASHCMNVTYTNCYGFGFIRALYYGAGGFTHNGCNNIQYVNCWAWNNPCWAGFNNENSRNVSYIGCVAGMHAPHPFEVPGAPFVGAWPVANTDSLPNQYGFASSGPTDADEAYAIGSQTTYTNCIANNNLVDGILTSLNDVTIIGGEYKNNGNLGIALQDTNAKLTLIGAIVDSNWSGYDLRVATRYYVNPTNWLNEAYVYNLLDAYNIAVRGATYAYGDYQIANKAESGWLTVIDRDTAGAGDSYINLRKVAHIGAPSGAVTVVDSAIALAKKLYLYGSVDVEKKDGSNWLAFIVRDTTQAETRMDLRNVGTVTFSGNAGALIYIGRDGSGNLVLSDSASGMEYTLSQLAGSAPVGDSSAFIYKVTGGAYVGDTLEISPTGYISIGRSGKVVTFTPDTSAGKLATQTMNNLKLAKTDTASLSSRINLKLTATDTASLSSRINLKLNSSAAFIGGYTVSRVDSMKLATGTGISMSQSGGNITITATELRKVPAYGVATNTFLRNDSTWAVPPGADGIDTAAVMGLISDSTVLIATASGYSTKDSSGVIVNGPYSVPQVLLASITLDSSCQFLTDTTQIGYVKYKSVIDAIVLYSNSTVSLTPRFLNVSTPIITTPAAFTAARTATTLSSFNAPNVAAGSMLHLVLDAIVTKGTKLSIYVWGHYVP